MFYDDPSIVKIKEEGVWLGKGFVSKENCRTIVEHIEAFTEKDWQDGWARHQATLFYTNDPESEKPLSDWWNDKVSPPILMPLVNEININLKSLFAPEFIFLPEYKVTRLKPGQKGHLPHRDNRGNDFRSPDNGTDDNNIKQGIKQEFTIQCAYTIYLSEFDGGEINYPELNYTHTPVPGDIVIHSSDILHEVFDVTKNNRYTITGWLLGK